VIAGTVTGRPRRGRWRRRASRDRLAQEAIGPETEAAGGAVESRAGEAESGVPVSIGRVMNRGGRPRRCDRRCGKSCRWGVLPGRTGGCTAPPPCGTVEVKGALGGDDVAWAPAGQAPGQAMPAPASSRMCSRLVQEISRSTGAGPTGRTCWISVSIRRRSKAGVRSSDSRGGAGSQCRVLRGSRGLETPQVISRAAAEVYDSDR